MEYSGNSYLIEQIKKTKFKETQAFTDTLTKKRYQTMSMETWDYLVKKYNIDLKKDIKDNRDNLNQEFNTLFKLDITHLNDYDLECIELELKQYRRKKNEQ